MNTINIFKNHSLDTDSYEYNDSMYKYSQIGGSNDKPTGGFPPIYLCSQFKDKTKEKQTEEKTKREYKTHKTSLSIKDILEKRKL